METDQTKNRDVFILIAKTMMVEMEYNEIDHLCK